MPKNKDISDFVKHFFTGGRDSERIVSRFTGFAMLLASSDHTPFRRVIIPLAAGLIVLSSLMRGPAQAANQTFIIGANEGYGILDCMADGVSCGRVVADTWCESHSRGPAVAYGLASDITGSTGLPTPQPAPGDVIITCGE